MSVIIIHHDHNNTLHKIIIIITEGQGHIASFLNLVSGSVRAALFSLADGPDWPATAAATCLRAGQQQQWGHHHQQLQWGPVQIYNTTLTCGAAAASNAAATPPPVTLVAETAQQLLRGIQLLGQLQPSTITLARDMSVPADTWPKGLVVNRSMVLTGLPPPAPRVLLDLYQVRWGAGSAHLSTSATA